MKRSAQIAVGVGFVLLSIWVTWPLVLHVDEALPGDLPHHFEVDLTKLVDIDQSFHVSDLNVVKGVELLVEPETVIATITAQMTVEEEAALAGPADVTEVKVETEEEKAAREAVKAEGGVPEKTEKPEKAGKPEKAEK